MFSVAGEPAPDPVLVLTTLPEGTVLVSGQEGLSQWWTMLTRSGDYSVNVEEPGSPSSFQLTIEAPAPVRFPSGTGSAARSGPTPGGLPVDYVVHAVEGQTISASVTSSDGAAGLALTRLGDPTTHAYPTTQQLGTDNYRFVAPSNGDYIISVVPLSGSVINYTLRLGLSN